MNWRKRILAAALSAVLLVYLTATASGADLTPETVLEDTVECVLKRTPAPSVGAVGGEWAVLGLARSGHALPEDYCARYYKEVEHYAAERGGVLSTAKYTEYARVSLALTAIGKDPRNVAGYDLTAPLGDFEKTVWQGVNGPVWALIALDCRNYPVPQNPQAKTQATRQGYVDEILARQLSNGGWSLSGSAADPDLTAMALQALAPYRTQAPVAQAVDRGLACLSALQNRDGTFSAQGEANAESTAQVIAALCALDLSPEDPRFVKNGHTLLDGLLTFRRSDGSFLHTAGGGGSSQMATEQALLALTALDRAETGQKGLYQMTDAADLTGGSSAQGLPGKHADVTPVPVTTPGKTFSDITGHPNQTAIGALAARGIINGMTETTFAPDDTMTRAQFAAIVVRGLGLPQKAGSAFSDVKAGDWFAPYVGTACAYGIVNGRSAAVFDPNGTITRQEAAVMVARAARLCGLDTELDDAAVRDVLSQFTDYPTAADWAKEGLAFCYRQGVLEDSALTIRPTAHILRCEIAQMLYNLLGSAQLL